MIANLMTFDEYWFRRLNDLSLNPQLTAWIFAFALYGIALYLLLFINLWYRRDNRSTKHYHQKTVVLSALAIGLTMVVIQVSDVVFFRPRPAVLYQDIVAFNVLIDQASFPSLHTAVAFGVTSVLWFMRYRKLAVVSFGWAILIGLSRVAAGVHYPTDIIGGIIVGFLAGYFVYREAVWLREYLPTKKRKNS